MAQPTPGGTFQPVHGPWRVEPGSYGGFALYGSDRHGNQILPILAHFGNHPKRAEANARLAAAAPDMLAALEAVNRIVSEGAAVGFLPLEGDWADRLYRSQQATAAAIRRAGGRLGSQQSATPEPSPT